MRAQGQPRRFAVAGQDALQPGVLQDRTERVRILHFLYCARPGDAQAVGHGRAEFGLEQPGRIQAAHQCYHPALGIEQGHGFGTLRHRAHSHGPLLGGMWAQ